MAESKQNNGRQPRRRTNITLPALSVDITLNTVFAQRVFNRVWDRLKGDIFTLTVRSRAVGRDDVADTSENLLKDQFDKVREDLAGDIQRADHLMDELGITELGRYDGAQRIAAQFTTPQAKTYLDLVLAMDQLIMRFEALWLNGEIDTKSCKDRSYEWQRRLIKTANRLRQVATSGKKTLDAAQEARNKSRAKSEEEAPAPAAGANGAEESSQPATANA